MHKLKELRTTAGYTQKELAAKLGTTQQTIARWESNQTAIPSASLRDIAGLFGRSVDELLGVGRPSTTAALVQPDHRLPFGTLTANFGFGSREYPIDNTQHRALTEACRPGFSLEAFTGWIAFSSLDNRLVFLNPASLRHLSLMSAPTEVMPFFVSPEAYRSLTLPTPADQISEAVADEQRRLIKHMAPRETETQKALEKVEAELASLKVIFTDGGQMALYLSDEIARGIALLLWRLKDVGPDAWAAVKDGHDLHLVNLSKVAALEVPLEACRAYIPEGPDDG